MHPRSKQWHMLDYVIVKQRDRRDVLLTRAMRGAECWTDHRLVRSLLSLQIQPRSRKKTKKQKKLNCAALKSKDIQTSFAAAISNNMADAPALEELDDCIEESSSHLTQTITNTAEAVLGFTNQNKDWFNENIVDIRNLLKAKNEAHRAFLNNPSSDYLKKQW